MTDGVSSSQSVSNDSVALPNTAFSGSDSPRQSAIPMRLLPFSAARNRYRSFTQTSRNHTNTVSNGRDRSTRTSSPLETSTLLPWPRPGRLLGRRDRVPRGDPGGPRRRPRAAAHPPSRPRRPGPPDRRMRPGLRRDGALVGNPQNDSFRGALPEARGRPSGPRGGIPRPSGRPSPTGGQSPRD